MTKEYILEFIKNHYNEIKEFGVEKIGLFGSYAKENNNESSDIDIIVKFGNVKSIFYSYFDLKNYLEDSFKTKIDLCREEDLKKEFHDEIKRSVIYV